MGATEIILILTRRKESLRFLDILFLDSICRPAWTYKAIFTPQRCTLYRWIDLKNLW